MSRPSFSIIIPFYNASITLDAAVQSVLQQTLQDFEVLMIDDRSTDGSYDLAKQWGRSDSRIRVFRLKKNSGGPIRPRNEGLLRAEGNLLAFLDADDRWLPAKLETQQLKHEEKAFALTYTRCLFDAPEYPLLDGLDYHTAWRLTPLEGTQLPSLTRSNFVPACTVSVQREWVKKLGPFTGIDGIEDWHYWLRIAASGGQFGFIDEVLAVYRWMSTSLSHRRKVSAVAMKARTLRSMAMEFPDYTLVFATEEKRFRQRATELRLRRLPKPIRAFASRALLPPRLWANNG